MRGSGARPAAGAGVGRGTQPVQPGRWPHEKVPPELVTAVVMSAAAPTRTTRVCLSASTRRGVSWSGTATPSQPQAPWPHWPWSAWPKV